MEDALLKYYQLIGYVILSVVLTGIIIIQEVVHRKHMNRLHSQNKDLMNRLMARDFQEYAGGERIINRAVSDVDVLENALNLTKEEKELADGLPVD